jgi:hypothetical protein
VDPIANLCHLVVRNARYHEEPPPAHVWRWLDNCIHKMMEKRDDDDVLLDNDVRDD